jgi:hypothetical protein
VTAILRRPFAITAVLVALTGCGVRVSLGEYMSVDPSADGGTSEPDAEEPFDAELLDGSAETDPPEASDEDAFFDDGPTADVTVD